MILRLEQNLLVFPKYKLAARYILVKLHTVDTVGVALKVYGRSLALLPATI